jgi:hypothetical protein
VTIAGARCTVHRDRAHPTGCANATLSRVRR